MRNLEELQTSEQVANFLLNSENVNYEINNVFLINKLLNLFTIEELECLVFLIIQERQDVTLYNLATLRQVIEIKEERKQELLKFYHEN